MNIKKFIGTILAIGFAGLVHLQAQSNLTQQILNMRTFREGLVLTGTNQPNEAENKELLEVLTHLRERWWTTGLEQFLTDHPDSPWAASLHYDYACFCRRTGRTTKALEHFQAAWELVKNENGPQGQRLGGAVLSNWMDLLSSLGRSKTLERLISDGDHWRFVNPHDRDKYQGAKNSYFLMQKHPEMAYRCGTFALKAVGDELEPTNHALEGLVEVPSPTNGFSMANLVDMAKKYGLNMVAVRRTAGQNLIVPSVIHWRQNHYAAILRQQDGYYLVSDPTFGNQKWMPAEVINEEASGEFSIPASLKTKGWAELARNDAKTIHGMGLPNNINDGKDCGCPKKCANCKGMPVWWVTEPYINLWMADQPLSYLTSRGEPFTFEIDYKQRDSRQTPNDDIVCTVGWNNSWTSYIHCYGVGIGGCEAPNNKGCLVGPGTDTETVVFLPDGGEVDFGPGQTYDQQTRTTLLYLSPSRSLSNGEDNGDNGLRVVYADGSQDIYGFVSQIGVVTGDEPETIYLRTRHIDANGDTTWFQYDETGGYQAVWPVTFVVDPDGRTNVLTYIVQGADTLLASVTNAYGQSAHFKYDSSDNLTNIVDAQGLSSSISYDTNGYPTSLVTPYGTTVFSIYSNPSETSTNDTEGNNGGDTTPYIDRAIHVTDPVGANYLYLYQYDGTALFSTSYSSSDVPTNTPIGTLDTGVGGTNFLTGICYRNSFSWGPRQYALLSTTNIFSLTFNDYLRGRMQHWLEDTDQLDLTAYVSVQQDPSPDGSMPGLLTFYDYQGKLPGYNFCEGTNALPSVIAWRLPGDETHYEYLQYDSLGNIIADVATCTLPNGSPGTRTNQFIYANNTYNYTFGNWVGGPGSSLSGGYTIPNLLTAEIGPDGNTNWAYGGFDTVTWTNFYYPGGFGGPTNFSEMTSSRVLPDYTTNAIGQITTTTFLSGNGNPATVYDMWPGTPSQPNVDYGTAKFTSFPGCSKVASVTTAAGLTTTNIYGTNGFLVQTIAEQIGRTNSFGYTADGLVGTFTNELGLNVSATWDNLLRLTGVQFPDGTSISNVYTKLDITARQDRLGNWSYFDYDGARHLIAATNANGAVTFYDWCGCGDLIGIIDALTNVTSFNYDNQGNLTNITYPDESQINYQYNLAAWPTNLSDGAGRSVQFTFDNQGLITSASNVYGQLYSRTYDIRDRPLAVTDPNDVTITNNYDLIDELLSKTWPDGISERFGYAASGLIAYTNRDNQITRLGRDVAERLVAVTNANNEVVQLAYNASSEITALTNGLRRDTIWQYNQYGWMTNKADGLGRNAFQFSYNPNSWVTNRWTPEKGNTRYTYDNVGNLKSIIYPQLTISYGYDAINELTNMVDASGTNTFAYLDKLLASETGPWAYDTVSYGYSQGLRTALNVSQSSGFWWQTNGYDSMWRITSVSSLAGTFSYSYDFQPASSLVSGISLPNGASIANGYDSLGRLTQTALANHWGHTLDGYTYALDPLGLRTNILRNLLITV